MVKDVEVLGEWDHLSFRLSDSFVAFYAEVDPPWGFDIGGGNSLGEITWFTKYSRTKADGTKERWFEGCRRVVEGTYSILKDHCLKNRTAWNAVKAQRAAENMYERLFYMKWSPPGRGLWMMGTKFVFEEGSASLQNCSFLSSEKLGVRNPTLPFVRLMEMSMLGIGVGFDTRGAGKLDIYAPNQDNPNVYTIPDSREGWCESLNLLLRSYFLPGHSTVEFEYHLIRPAGEPIVRFGGVAAGPASLKRLHVEIRALLDPLAGTPMSSTTIVDIGNMVGKCVVAGNVRRSAEIALGFADDPNFLKLKDGKANPARNGYAYDSEGKAVLDDSGWPIYVGDGWGHLSNNSVIVSVGDNLDAIADQVIGNGEPGVIFMDLMRSHGRLNDPANNKDHRAKGCNPCMTGDSLMLTSENGMVPIRDLTDRPFTLWNGQEWSESIAWHSGVKPVFRVQLNNGQSISLTGNHKLAVWTEGDEKGRGSIEVEMTVEEISSLVTQGRGPKIRPLLGNPEWSGNDIEKDTAVMLGLLMGDGYCSSFSRSTSAYIKTGESEVLNFLSSMDDGSFNIKTPIGGKAQESKVTGWVKIAQTYGIDISTNLPNRAFPSSAMQWSSETQRSVLRGLFSANGSAMSGHSRISLKTTCRELAGQVQTMLLALGFAAYITTNKESLIKWPNGTYTSKESYDVSLAGHAQYERFQAEIGFIHNHKSLSAVNNRNSSVRNQRTSRVVSVTAIGTQDVYDFTEPSVHWGWVNGFKSHNCAEQILEDHECVIGETRIQTRLGNPRIEDVVGESVEVWNGNEWSEVTPFKTGVRPVSKVTFSDGSVLTASDNHEWSIRTNSPKFRKVKTGELVPGMILPEFSLGEVGGDPFMDAYLWGWMAGDGYMDKDYSMVLVQESEYKALPLLGGIVRKEQSYAASGKKFRRVNVSSIVSPENGRALRDHYNGLPEEIFSWSNKSIAEFMAGWIDTDGSVITNPNTHHYLLYGTEGKLRDAQALLRRIGVNHSTLRLFSPEGAVTNKGTRNYGLWRLLVPSYEAELIPTVIKVATKFGSRMERNNAHPDGAFIDHARNQKVVSVESLGSDETFCFTEPKLGMGVFGNSITYQCCTLTETYPTNCEDYEDYRKTLKVAYLYAKAVTLLPTHWAESNEVMGRNRRIGTSMTGLAMFAEDRGWTELRTWCDRGYDYINHKDREYSEWLGVRESIKTTSIKPSGTVSLLAGVTPGVHWPVAGGQYFRRVRYSKHDMVVPVLLAAGYHVEPSVADPDSDVVVTFPTTGPAVRSEREVSVWEKVSLAALMQKYWADNMVSATFTFKPEEEQEIKAILKAMDGQMKSMSFLPMGEEFAPGAYAQMPYEKPTNSEFASLLGCIEPLDMKALYSSSREADGEKFCSNESCEIGH